MRCVIPVNPESQPRHRCEVAYLHDDQCDRYRLKGLDGRIPMTYAHGKRQQRDAEHQQEKSHQLQDDCLSLTEMCVRAGKHCVRTVLLFSRRGEIECVIEDQSGAIIHDWRETHGKTDRLCSHPAPDFDTHGFYAFRVVAEVSACESMTTSRSSPTPIRH